MTDTPDGALKLTRLRLDSMPLPSTSSDDDKDHRGVVLVIGGSETTPGAVLLAGIGALRAGAGKLQMATVRKAAMPLGLALPEALVMALPTSKAGEIAATGTIALLQPLIEKADAVLLGPGMSDKGGAARLMQGIVAAMHDRAVLVLDGAAAIALRDDSTLLHALGARAIITPHAGEMASLAEMSREDVQGDPAGVAQRSAERFRAVVVLKGGETWIAHPSEPLLQYRDGKVGLATSGSGDTLAGIVAGLAARGASPTTAAAWGVWAHGSAGNKLSRSVGRLGFLASELLHEIPALVNGG